MTAIMDEAGEVRTGGHRLQVPVDLRQQIGDPIGRGTIRVGNVVNGTEAVDLGAEVIGEGTAQTGEFPKGAMVIGLGVTVDLTKDVKTSRGMIRGRPLEGWAHSSGPHWPQEKMGSTGAKVLLRPPGR